MRMYDLDYGFALNVMNGLKDFLFDFNEWAFDSSKYFFSFQT